MVSDNRCPYFFLSVGEIALPGQRQPLRVPICRCVLTEVLTERLQALPEGQKLTALLVGEPLDGQPRPMIGSDLEPISPVTCTPERLQARCLPGFYDILSDLGAETSVPAPKPSR